MNSILRVACLLVGAAMCAPSPAGAATVSQSYTGTVTRSLGAQAGALPVGATIDLSYTLETATPDANSLHDQGIFFGAIQSLRVAGSNGNLILTMTTGTVQTFDNVVLSGVTLTDQVLMFSREFDASTALDGQPILEAQLAFIEVTDLDGHPTMIDGDAIPVEPIAAPQVFLEVVTDLGYTTLSLELEPARLTVNEIVADAKLRIAELTQQGLLGRGIGISLVAKLDVVLAASMAGRNGVCGPLTGLRNQIGNLHRGNATDVAVADELAAIVAVLTEAIGVCGPA